MSKIIVYSKPGCIQCVSTVKRLESRGLTKGVDFDYVDVTKDEAAYTAATSTGFQSMPIVVSGSDKWSGFNPDRLDAIRVPLRA